MNIKLNRVVIRFIAQPVIGIFLVVIVGISLAWAWSQV